MKRTLIKLCTAFSLVMGAAPAFAASEANIHMGDYQVGGSFGYQHYSTEGFSDDLLTLNPKVEYFLLDHFSLGGTVSFSKDFNSGGNTQVGVGPSGTYYFWEDGKCAAYFALGAAWSHSSYGDGSHSYSITPSVGYHHFFTPSVAFGPALTWTHMFSTGGSGALNSYGLVGNFSLYL